MRLLSSGAESCPVELRSENASCVTVCLGVTVLLFEITVATVIKKFQQKYEWIVHVIFHHHAKFEMQRNFVQDATKK